MRETHTTGRAWCWAGVALVGFAVASACAPKAVGRQTAIMQKTGEVSVSAAQLRAQVNELAGRIAGRVEETADRIRADTHDRAVRRRALVFKTDAIPAVYSAAYHVDPLAAAMDVWAFAFQLTQYVENGTGRDAFGAEQPLARKCAQDIVADTDAVVRAFATRPEGFDRARGRTAEWAKAHPIENTFASRASLEAFMAEMQSEEQDAFRAMGAVSETIGSVSERLNTWAALLPKQSRWQAELLADDMTGARDVEGMLDDINTIGTAARHASGFMDNVNGVLGTADSSIRQTLDAERKAVLEGVNDQRVHTLAYMTSERLAVVASAREERIALVEALRQERIAVIDALRQERIAGLKEVDGIKSRAVDASIAGLRDLVDYAFWRVAALLVFLLVSATAAGVIGYRLTLGRHRDVTPS